jgi:HAD superfamily hydrolase (TIGR01509 family)
MKKYKNYLFDFGGVLYHIDINNALRQFRQFSSNKEMFDDKTPSFLINNNTIDLYEKGFISTYKFRAQIKNDFGLDITNKEFDDSWNSILLHMDENAVRVIKTLADFASISLLSNTSPLHYQQFSKECNEMFALFDNLYFSFQIGMRKPEAKAFNHVIKHSGYLPEETLFVDDTEANIIVASELGFNVMRINDPSQLSDLLHSV